MRQFKFNKTNKYALLLSVVAVLAACGGSNGGEVPVTSPSAASPGANPVNNEVPAATPGEAEPTPTPELRTVKPDMMDKYVGTWSGCVDLIVTGNTRSLGFGVYRYEISKSDSKSGKLTLTGEGGKTSDLNLYTDSACTIVKSNKLSISGTADIAVVGQGTINGVDIDKVLATSGANTVKYAFATSGASTLLVGNGMSANGATVDTDGYPTVLSQTLAK
jgi:hypothetical protein